MVKVLLIGPSLKSVGGVSAVLRNYLSIIKDEFEKHGNEVTYIFHSTQIDGNKMVKFTYAILSLISFQIKLIRYRPNIVHAQTGIGMGFWRKSIFLCVSKLYRCKTVLHLHTSSKPYFNNLDPFMRKLFTKVLQKVDYIITVTLENKQFIKSLLEDEDQKITMLDNPISTKTNSYNKLITTTSMNDSLYFLHLGELSKDKGIFDFLNLAKAVQDAKLNFEFLAAGKGNIGEIKEYVQKNNITNFRYLGFIDENKKKEIFKKTKFLVLLTRFDQKPIVIQEALAHAVPCIVSNVGGIPEMVYDKVNGFVFKPNEFSSIINTLLELTEEKYKEMMQNAFTSAQRYKPSFIALKLIDIYKKLIFYDGKV